LAFTFAVDLQAMIKEREAQLRSQRSHVPIFSRVSRCLSNFWSFAGPAEAKTAGDLLLTSLRYGSAKYPCLGNIARRLAQLWFFPKIVSIWKERD
jgi:hypothetical protein